MVFGAAMFRVAGRRLFVRSSRRTSRPIDIRPNRPRTPVPKPCAFLSRGARAVSPFCPDCRWT
jgi:hypothetical protein